jgi:hypothetical protein
MRNFIRIISQRGKTTYPTDYNDGLKTKKPFAFILIVSNNFYTIYFLKNLKFLSFQFFEMTVLIKISNKWPDLFRTLFLKLTFALREIVLRGIEPQKEKFRRFLLIQLTVNP